MIADQYKSDGLQSSIRKMNILEQEELKKLGQDVDKEGNLTVPSGQSYVQRIRNFLDPHVTKMSKQHEKVINQSRLFQKVLENISPTSSRRDFLKGMGILGTYGTLKTTIPSLDSGTHSGRESARNERLTEQTFTRFQKIARDFLLEWINRTNRTELLEEYSSEVSVDKLDFDQLLDLISSYYQDKDLTTSGQQKIADHMRLHFLCIKAIDNLFQHPNVEKIRLEYPFLTPGDMIRWYATIFSAGEFANVLDGIVLDYQSEPSRCIAGKRDDALIWANKLPELFTRYFTSLFRDEIENIDDTLDWKQSEIIKQSLWSAECLPEIEEAGFRAMIRALEYSDKFCSSANHRPINTSIGIEDTVSVLERLSTDRVLGQSPLANVYEITTNSLSEEIREPLPNSSEIILDVFAYTAIKAADGVLDRTSAENTRNANLIEFWSRYGKPNHGSWLTMPEGILSVTISETANAITVAIGGQAGSPIKDLEGALNSTSANNLKPTLRSDGLTQPELYQKILVSCDIHLGRQLAIGYVKKMERQLSLAKQLEEEATSSRIGIDERNELRGRLDLNRIQLRLSEIVPQHLLEVLKESTQFLSDSPKFLEIKKLLLEARPTLTENSGLNTQIFLQLILKQFGIVTPLELADSQSEAEMNNLSKLLGDTAMAPYRVVEFYTNAANRNLLPPSSSTYTPYSLNVSRSMPSPILFPISQLEQSYALFDLGSKNQEGLNSFQSVFIKPIETSILVPSISENHNAILQHCGWGVGFDMDKKSVHFFIHEKREGMLAHFVVSPEGIQQIPSLNADETGMQELINVFGERLFFVGKPPVLKKSRKSLS